VHEPRVSVRIKLQHKNVISSNNFHLIEHLLESFRTVMKQTQWLAQPRRKSKTNKQPNLPPYFWNIRCPFFLFPTVGAIPWPGIPSFSSVFIIDRSYKQKIGRDDETRYIFSFFFSPCPSSHRETWEQCRTELEAPCHPPLALLPIVFSLFQPFSSNAMRKKKKKTTTLLNYLQRELEHEIRSKRIIRDASDDFRRSRLQHNERIKMSGRVQLRLAELIRL
jgi:hypothetical protein